MTQQGLGRPQVEALSDVAWARVERNVLSRMESTITHASAAREMVPPRSGRNNFLVWLAVPAAAAAAFALAFFSMNDSTGTKPATAPADEQPSRIVASDSPSTVSFGDTHVTLSAHTAVVMDQAAQRPTALLEQG